MKFVAAMLKHETNSFSPVPTPLERFGPQGPYFHEAAAKAYAGTRTILGAYLDLARAEGAEVVTPVAGEASPSGPAEAEVYEQLSQAIIEAVSAGCDAAFLDLHGAMISQSTDDGEGTLLKRLRSLAPDLPIAVGLDMHTNLTSEMVDNATVIAGYKTCPHVDLYETGRLSGEILIRSLKGRVKPVMAWGNLPMLPHTMRMDSDESPLKELVAAARAMERQDALAATVFTGFPQADMEQAGLGAVVVTDGRLDRAEALRDRLLDLAWEKRADFVYESEPLAESVARAKALSQGPVLLIDHADNCGSGGTQDTMTVVREVLEQGLEDVAVGAVTDPQAVALMHQAGVGAKLTLPLGGKTDMPSIGLKGQPLTLNGEVKALSDGRFTITGPMYTGVKVSMGRSALFDLGSMQIVVIEKNHEPFDLGVFTSLGLDPTAKRYLLLKSRLHYRAAFKPIAKAIVECAGTGVTSSDFSQYPFRKLRRPIYPLDPDTKR